MFESLRTWIEGLFRSVSHQDVSGYTYINRTPTINDVDLVKRLKRIKLSYAFPGPAVATVISFPVTTVPAGRDWVIVNVSATDIDNAAGSSFTAINLMVNLENTYYAPISQPVMATGQAGLIMGAEALIYQRQGIPFCSGTKFYPRMWINGSVGNYYCYIYYYEV